MARKWSNLNLTGALHYVTGNFLDRAPVFTDPECCTVFLDELQTLSRNWPGKLITYVLYSQSDKPLAVDHDWWWPEDSEKLSQG